MNCDEYRVAIAADPSFDGGAGHLTECAACQSYRAEMQALDQTISRALSLDVPALQMPELPEVSELSAVEADNVIALRKRSWSSPTWSPQIWLATAATVVVAALLGVRLIGTAIEHESLADEIIAHLDHEPFALRVTDVAVTDERLRSVVPADVAEVQRNIGLITYAQSCIINGHDVPHLVIQGERGPITILLMPEEMLGEPQPLMGESIDGVILPVGNGSIAIIGEKEEALEKFEQQILKTVMWTT
jgi:hypothetical protein